MSFIQVVKLNIIPCMFKNIYELLYFMIQMIHDHESGTTVKNFEAS